MTKWATAQTNGPSLSAKPTTRSPIPLATREMPATADRGITAPPEWPQHERLKAPRVGGDTEHRERPRFSGRAAKPATRAHDSETTRAHDSESQLPTYSAASKALPQNNSLWLRTHLLDEET